MTQLLVTELLLANSALPSSTACMGVTIAFKAGPRSKRSLQDLQLSIKKTEADSAVIKALYEMQSSMPDSTESGSDACTKIAEETIGYRRTHKTTTFCIQSSVAKNESSQKATLGGEGDLFRKWTDLKSLFISTLPQAPVVSTHQPMLKQNACNCNIQE